MASQRLILLFYEHTWTCYTFSKSFTASQSKKIEPRKLKGFGHQTFSVTASLVWNSLSPTSDTVVPPHSSKLLLRPFSSLLLFPSYIDSLEDLRLFFSVLTDYWCLCGADLPARGRVTDRRRDGGGWGWEGEKGRDWMRERVI